MGIILSTDKHEIVPTSSFKYATFPFEKFNVVQSSVFDFYKDDINAIIASKTSSGKTATAEMFISYDIQANNKKCLFIAPMKSLAQEKYNAWTDPKHYFARYNVSICTGDYALTADRKKELEQADIIIMSNEMFASRVRNIKSEKSNFLSEVGTIVMDEAHLLGVPQRGDHTEVGLANFTHFNHKAKVIMLSGTMPNSEEIGEWLSYLNGKITHVLKSNYRPCKLTINFEEYEDYMGSYDRIESSKIDRAIQILRRFPTYKVLMFVHTKKTGNILLQRLRTLGIQAEFHNADVDKKKRIKYHNDFNEGNLRVLVATSTLAWGIDCPARIVIIVGVHSGMREVEKYDIDQMSGRSGRPKYDKEGDAYVLIPTKTANLQKKRLTTDVDITSQLYNEDKPDIKLIGFHLVGEIHAGNIKNKKDVQYWYERTLAYHQTLKLKSGIIEEIIDSLKRCGAIIEEDGEYKTTHIGKIASLFYYSPYDVSDLRKNFANLFEMNKDGDDIWLSYALANTSSLRDGIVSSSEKEELESFIEASIESKIKNINYLGLVKAAYCYHCMLNGASPYTMYGFMNGLKTDSGRLLEIISSLGTLDRNFINKLQTRINYGVEEELLNLINLDGVGRVKARKLANKGVMSYDDIIKNPDRIIDALRCTKATANKIIEHAKELKFLGENNITVV